MRFLFTILLTLLLLLGLFFWFVYSGVYNVAATAPHTGVAAWVLEQIETRSVRARSEGIKTPTLTDSLMVQTGLRHFREMCVLCHGAPGISPSEIGRGLRPEPPDLSREVPDRTPEELYWIVQNGIKMTGMPAFGPTHTENELWAIVAFLVGLPDLTPEAYEALLRAQDAASLPLPGDAGGHEDGHTHGPVPSPAPALLPPPDTARTDPADL